MTDTEETATARKQIPRLVSIIRESNGSDLPPDYLLGMIKALAMLKVSLLRFEGAAVSADDLLREASLTITALEIIYNEEPRLTPETEAEILAARKHLSELKAGRK